MKRTLKTFKLNYVVLAFLAVLFIWTAKSVPGQCADKMSADLDGDGKVEKVSTESNGECDYENYTGFFNFYLKIDGKTLFKEELVITSMENFYDVAELGYIEAEIVDINPDDKYKEILLKYYCIEDDLLLKIKILRLQKGKLKCICDDESISGYSYFNIAQGNNKYINVAVDFWNDSLGCVWIKNTYKIKNGKLVLKKAKNDVYTALPDFSATGSYTKFKTTVSLKIYSDSACTKQIDTLAKGNKFYVKKLKLVNYGKDSEIGQKPMAAYVKTSTGIKGWIYLENDFEKPEVSNRRLFA